MNVSLNVGDKVSITGKIGEYQSMTQIQEAVVVVLSEDNDLPEPVTLTSLEAISNYHANHISVDGLVFVSISSDSRNIKAKLLELEVDIRSKNSYGDVFDLFKTFTDGDLINLTNVYVDSYSGTIQLLVEDINQIERIEKELTDLEKINFVKDELTELLNNKEFEMGSDANLPAKSLFESTITWESTPVAVVDGKWFDVTADTPVELTATIKVGDLTEELVLNVVKFEDDEEQGQTYTATIKAPEGSTNGAIQDVTASTLNLDGNIFTVDFTNNSSNNGLYIGNPLRFYAGTTTMVSISSDYIITNIVIGNVSQSGNNANPN